MKCIPCKGGDPKVTPQQISEYLPQIPKWEIVEKDEIKKLRREFIFKNFSDAVQFSNNVADSAEEVDHHPAILTEWGKVTITWWTYIINGLHENDFIMAAKVDGIYDHIDT